MGGEFGGAGAASGPIGSGYPPAVARTIFGERLELAGRYVDLLATAALTRGILGPREVPRLWERHLLNCAVISELIPPGAAVVDVGSGAGLPGIALALARPDITVTLLEPMARRAAFLTEVVTELDLANVSVGRARAEEWQRRTGAAGADGGCPVDIVTARAVAPLDRLVGWCLPLVAPGGRLLAIKGKSAGAELEEARAAITRAGGIAPRMRVCGASSLDPPTTVIEIVRGSGRAPRKHT